MSLILEALRRSEAERQLGRAPDVLAPMAVLRPTHHARRWPWWLALALLLATLALWAGWSASQRAGRQAIPAPVVPRIAARTAQESEPATADIDGITLPLKSSSPSSLRGQTSAAASGAVAAPGAPKPQQTPAPVPQASAAPPIQTIAPTFPAPAGPAVATDGVDTAAGKSDALESIADLPTAERAALPPLQVSMHVYAEQPGDRFMIVDGARVGEGARIGDRIVLVQIRRDGAVLDIGGRRVLLPKP